MSVKYKIIILIFFFLLSATPTVAQHFDQDYFDDPVNFYFQIGDTDDDGNPKYLRGGNGEVRGSIILGNKDPRLIIVGVINLVLGFLGIIALVIIIMSGFKLMLASGNQDEAIAAKKSLISGVIGLIIIFSAFGIAKFIISSLAGAIA